MLAKKILLNNVSNILIVHLFHREYLQNRVCLCSCLTNFFCDGSTTDKTNLLPHSVNKTHKSSFSCFYLGVQTFMSSYYTYSLWNLLIHYERKYGQYKMRVDGQINLSFFAYHKYLYLFAK